VLSETADHLRVLAYGASLNRLIDKPRNDAKLSEAADAMHGGYTAMPCIRWRFLAAQPRNTSDIDDEKGAD